MKTITKKQFLADVRHEIDMLKLHATEEEKSNLNFEGLDPKRTKRCIYGQMTGTCESTRAKELMNMACIREINLSESPTMGVEDIFKISFSEAKQFINGEYSGKTWDKSGFGRRFRFLSALEGYINLSGAKNKQIIAYIKGEIDNLTL